MAVTGIFQFAAAPIAGRLAVRLDPRAMLCLGLGLFGTGVFLNSILTSQTAFADLFLPQTLRGLALMFCFVPINGLALGTLSPERLKNASGLYNLMRNLGGAIGLAVINTALEHRMALHQGRLADHLNLAHPMVADTMAGLSQRLGDLGVAHPEQAAMAQLYHLLQREAYVLSFSDCLLLMSGVFFASLLLVPILRRPRPAGAGRGASTPPSKALAVSTSASASGAPAGTPATIGPRPAPVGS
jgi:DHA2 family multidrug resistance protein